MNDLKKLLEIHKLTGADVSACRKALSSAGNDVESAVELLTHQTDHELLAFFDESTWFTGPALTRKAVKTAEQTLGYKLPSHYINLLLQKNGGTPVNTCYPVDAPTSWADNHIAITGIRGIGGKYGIDIGSEQALHEEWGYPPGLVFAETPTAGHTVVMFDYSQCGSQGDPSVAWVDTYTTPATLRTIAADFSSFLTGLVHENTFEE